MPSFRTLGQSILVEKLGPRREREKEEREIMPLTMAPMFMPAAQGQRTHSARTNRLKQRNIL